MVHQGRRAAPWPSIAVLVGRRPPARRRSTRCGTNLPRRQKGVETHYAHVHGGCGRDCCRPLAGRTGIDGSLTTPPCSEGVALGRPVGADRAVGRRQIETFASAHPRQQPAGAGC